MNRNGGLRPDPRDAKRRVGFALIPPYFQPRIGAFSSVWAWLVGGGWIGRCGRGRSNSRRYKKDQRYSREWQLTPAPLLERMARRSSFRQRGRVSLSAARLRVTSAGLERALGGVTPSWSIS